MSGQRSGQAVRGILTGGVERVEAAIPNGVGSHHARRSARQVAVEFAAWPIMANDIQLGGVDGEGGV